MPRKKLMRRFEPRFGVSQPMLDAESIWVGREVEDYLLLSINELRGQIRERSELVSQTESVLKALVDALPERMHLAVQSMLIRDFLHIAMLYETYLRGESSIKLARTGSPATPEVKSRTPALVLPFVETLFEL